MCKLIITREHDSRGREGNILVVGSHLASTILCIAQPAERHFMASTPK